MDDDEEYERFDVDNDYEGGRFVDGEFVYERKREKRKWTKEDSIYGVFYDRDGDSDSDDGGGKRRGPGRKADFTKPVGFVKSDVILPSEPEKKEPPKTAAVPATDAWDTGRGGLGLGASKQSTNEEEEEEEEDGVEEGVLPTAFGRQILERAERRREEQKEAERRRGRGGEAGTSGSTSGGGAGLAAPAFEKHTKGIGMKLLQKMGFTGRLGKNEQGLSSAIEVKMRPKNMGMGYGDFQEQAAGGLGAKQAAAPAEEEEEKGGAQAEVERPKGKMWKKKHAAKRKVVYKTAEQLLDELAEAPAEERQTVIDMRGPQARVVKSMEELSSGVPASALADDTPMPELMHNLRLVVDLAEADIQRIDRKLRHEKDSILLIQSERDRLREEVERHQAQEQRLQEVVSLTERLEASEGLALEDMADVFVELQTEYREEYAMYGLSAIALSHALPRFRQMYSGWDPLASPQHGIAAAKTWRGLLAGEGPKDYSIYNDLASDRDPFARLLAETLLPPLRTAVCNAWEPRNPEPMIRFVELWEPILPPSVLDHLLLHLLLPKLYSAVEAWDPRLERVPIHAWLHPWLPLLGGHMESLYPPIRFKLANALKAWHPSDASAHALLSPWARVFPPEAWEQMLQRSIMPPLGFALRELVINPRNQVLHQFQWAMAWADCAPPHLMAALLDANFFPNWHAALRHWLASSPNYDEVVRWYTGWKALFPPDLAAFDRIRAHFTAALDTMNMAVAGEGAGGLPSGQPGPQDHVAHLRAAEQRRLEEAALRQQQQQGQALGAEEMSLREVVEQFAQECEVEFLPKAGRRHEGHPVYAFGRVTVALDGARQAVLAHRPGGTWGPVALDQLLAMHRAGGRG